MIKVYGTKLATVNELRAAIEQDCMQVTSKMLSDVLQFYNYFTLSMMSGVEQSSVWKEVLIKILKSVSRLYYLLKIKCILVNTDLLIIQCAYTFNGTTQILSCVCVCVYTCSSMATPLELKLV